jgi:predicted MFS family arabinose efflux permease
LPQRVRLAATGRASYAAGGALLAVAMGFGRFAYTPLLVVMQRDAGLDVAFAGVLASVNLAGYLAGALLATLAAVRARRFAVLRASLIVVVAATGLMALPAAWWAPLRFVTGVASGLAFVLTVSALLDRSLRVPASARVPWGFAGVGLGVAVAGALVPPFAAYGGSRGAWLGLAAIGAVLVAIALPILGDEPARVPGVASAAAVPSRKGNYPALLIAYGLEGAAYIIPATFLVAMVRETPSAAAYAPAAWIVVGLSAAPSAVAWNALGRAIGVAGSLLIALVVQALGMLACALVPGFIGALVTALTLGATFVGITFLTSALASELRPNSTNVAFGLLTAVYGVGQIAGPLIAVRVSLATGHYRDSLYAAAAMLLIGTAVYAASLRIGRPALR